VTTTFAGFPQSIDGLTLDMAAAPAPAVNDSFLIQPTRSGASALGVLFADPARLAAASPVRTTASMSNTGTGAISRAASTPATPLGAALTTSYSTATGR
jgi:flagellar hook-associated protein 1 FlgK